MLIVYSPRLLSIPTGTLKSIPISHMCLYKKELVQRKRTLEELIVDTLRENKRNALIFFPKTWVDKNHYFQLFTDRNTQFLIYHISDTTYTSQ